MRAAIGGRGKRGGGRVIYYFLTARESCYLFAYSKSEQGDLTAAQLKRLVDVMNEELSDG